MVTESENRFLKQRVCVFQQVCVVNAVPHGDFCRFVVAPNFADCYGKHIR